MNRFAFSSSLVSAGLVAAACTTFASADVTISSPDGRWVATIEDVGGGAGQVTSMMDMSLPANERSFVANTVHFVRVGTTASFANAQTQRVEDLFTCVRFFAEGDNFTAILASQDLSGTIAMVNGEMVSGAQGGLRTSITFMDSAPSATQALKTVVKPFVYANLNVDGAMWSNVGGWAGGTPNGHFWQKRNGSVSNSERWFVGVGVDGFQTMSDSLMLDYLDNGATTLMNQVLTGPADLNSAMSWPEATIDSQSHTVQFGLGNVNLFVSPSFGTASATGLFIRSSDLRWMAKVSNTMESKAAFQYLLDQSQPSPYNLAAQQLSPYAFVATQSGTVADYLSASLQRLHLWVPGSSRRVSEISTLPSQPGVVVIFDGLMVDGEAGGAVGCMTWLDTAGQHPVVTPALYSDLDIDGIAPNQGGFEDDHFWMTAPSSPSGNVRWVRTTAHESHMLDYLVTVSTAFLAAQPLPNTATSAISDLGLAVRYPTVQLATNVPYVYGYAVGNPNIAIPPSFCSPTFGAACPADLNDDGTVDAADLSILLGNWGPWQPTSPDTDFNDDNVTDAADLSVMLGGWGSCG